MARTNAVLPAWQGQAAAVALPPTRLEVLSGCGHRPHVECPGAFVDAVAPFLRGIRRAVTPPPSRRVHVTAAPSPQDGGSGDGFPSGRLGNQRPMRTVLRRHPTRVELGAWFDGEHDGDVGAHVARCRRCQRDADALGYLRTLLRPATLRATEHVGRGAAPG